jgi:hypothetical protein
VVLLLPFTGCKLGFKLSKLWKNNFSTGTEEPVESIGVGSMTECLSGFIFFDGCGFLNNCFGICPKLLMKPIVAFFLSGSSMLWGREK